MRYMLIVLLLVLSGCQSPGKLVIETLEPAHNGFYHKQLNFEGILIRGHESVSDEALYEMVRRIKRVTKNQPNIIRNLAAESAPIHITGRQFKITDTPMWRHKKGTKTPEGKDFDKRKQALCCFTTFVTESGLLLLPSYRFFDRRDVPTHEFCHLIMNYGIQPALMHKIEDHYEATMDKGLWAGAYAATNADEFFAETSMWYFGTNGDTLKMVDEEKKIMLKKGPEPLKKYDPATYKLLDDFYKGRLEVKRFNRVELEKTKVTNSLGVEDEEGDKVRKVHMILDNRTDSPVTLQWLSYEGKLYEGVLIQPNSKYGVGTYKDHAWVVKDEDGNEIGQYMMIDKPAKITVR